MIVAAVVCPHPPLLLRELTGAQDPVPQLREACRRTLTVALEGAVEEVVVVGGDDRAAQWDPGSSPVPVGFGGQGDGGTRAAAGHPLSLPLSLAVGRRLLDEVGWSGPTALRTVSWSAGADEVERVAEAARGRGRTLLLVLGDGSARRGEQAPGYLDTGAFAFDDAVTRALAAGDALALRDLDAARATELMVLGRAAFAVLGCALTDLEIHESRVVHREDPYGVLYLVARFVLGPRPGSA